VKKKLVGKPLKPTHEERKGEEGSPSHKKERRNQEENMKEIKKDAAKSS